MARRTPGPGAMVDPESHDAVLVALEHVKEVLAANEDACRRATIRADEIARQRRQGRRYRDIVEAEHGALLVQLLSESFERLATRAAVSAERRLVPCTRRASPWSRSPGSSV